MPREFQGDTMKHLISATLSIEAGQMWESWPKGSRSRMLSELLANGGELVLRQKANLLMIGSLRGNIATHRRRIRDFMASTPPIDEAYSKMFEGIIYEMNEDLDGSIHHDPIQETD
jgi:hypothetical protein